MRPFRQLQGLLQNSVAAGPQILNGESDLDVGPDPDAFKLRAIGKVLPLRPHPETHPVSEVVVNLVRRGKQDREALGLPPGHERIQVFGIIRMADYEILSRCIPQNRWIDERQRLSSRLYRTR